MRTASYRSYTNNQSLKSQNQGRRSRTKGSFPIKADSCASRQTCRRHYIPGPSCSSFRFCSCWWAPAAAYGAAAGGPLQQLLVLLLLGLCSSLRCCCWWAVAVASGTAAVGPLRQLLVLLLILVLADGSCCSPYCGGCCF
jgi:hypothetical protein